MCLINVRDAFSLFQIKKKQNLGSILQNLSNSESVAPTFLYGLTPLRISNEKYQCMVARICNKLAGCFKTVRTIPFHISGVLFKILRNGKWTKWRVCLVVTWLDKRRIRTDGYMADGRMDNTFCSMCVNMTFKSMIPFG